MTNCKNCLAQQVIPLFSFGNMPLANRLLKQEDLSLTEPHFPLEMMLCTHCALVQLKETISPQSLYDEYLYFSSNSNTMVQMAQKTVATVLNNLPEKDATIIEIASNDGYLLQHYLHKNFKILGIEPAKNIAAFARLKNIPTISEYFSTHLANQLVKEGMQADIIHANNVLAHAPDINDFVQGIKILLKPKGQAIIEVPYLLKLVEQGEFDTIYHEHVYYFSLTALEALFSRHHLIIKNLIEIPIHGGSLRLTIECNQSQSSAALLEKYLSHEKKLDIHSLNYYQPFIKKINNLKSTLKELLYSIKQQGKKIAAYGASAKGSTLLNYFGIGAELIDFVVDKSPTKQGLYTPGNYLPIYPPERLITEKIDFTLLLTWNFFEEILKEQFAYREMGGQFIIPIPQLEIK